jgi:two-component system LytT family response regulator
MTLRILLVDDERAARRRLCTMLREFDRIEVVGEASDTIEALERARALQPDVILLDIDMPGRSGLDLVPLLDMEDRPIVIFVTAFDAYAVDAFGLQATDYLLKPVPLERLRASLERARAALAARHSADRLAEMADVIAKLRCGVRRAPDTHLDALWVPCRSTRLRVPVDQVDLIEAEHDYVRIHTAGGSHLLRDRISRLEPLLDPAMFLRIHRSAIVRRSGITALRTIAAGVTAIILGDGRELRIGRKYAAAARSALRATA